MTPPKPVECPCGCTPVVDSDEMTGMVAVECCNCGRLVGARGRAEALRMWNAALCNMQDKKSA